MGLSPFSNWTGNYQSPAVTGNPDPQNFKIIKTKTIGIHSLIYVNFPDCKNYGGDKILLIVGMTNKEIRKLKKLDPHFHDGQPIGEPYIVARFTPTKADWGMGLHMLKAINGEYMAYETYQKKEKRKKKKNEKQSI